MNEILKLLIGLIVLVLGIPLGDYLAKITKEELKDGQKWFRILVILGLIGGIFGFIVGKDYLMFSFFFIAVVASRSLKKWFE